MALSRARGEGVFEQEGRSEMEATLTSVRPYLRYAVSERLSVWGILGLGRGEMTLDGKGMEKRLETDIEMRMGAFGVRGALFKTSGFDLAVKSDLMPAEVNARGLLTHQERGFEEWGAGDLRILGVDGDPEAPGICAGDRVVVDISRTLPAPGGTYLFRDGGELVVRQVEAAYEDGRMRPDREVLDEVLWVFRRV